MSKATTDMTPLELLNKLVAEFREGQKLAREGGFKLDEHYCEAGARVAEGIAVRAYAEGWVRTR